MAPACLSMVVPSILLAERLLVRLARPPARPRHREQALVAPYQAPATPRRMAFANWKARCATLLLLRSSGCRAFFPESSPVDRCTSERGPGLLGLGRFLDLVFVQETARRFG